MWSQMTTSSISASGYFHQCRGRGYLMTHRLFFLSYAQLSDKDFESIMKGEANMEDFVPQETKKKEEKK